MEKEGTIALSRNSMFFFHPDFVQLHVTVGLGIAPSRHLRKVNLIDGIFALSVKASS